MLYIQCTVCCKWTGGQRPEFIWNESPWRREVWGQSQTWNCPVCTDVLLQARTCGLNGWPKSQLWISSAFPESHLDLQSHLDLCFLQGACLLRPHRVPGAQTRPGYTQVPNIFSEGNSFGQVCCGCLETKSYSWTLKNFHAPPSYHWQVLSLHQIPHSSAQELFLLW